MTAGATAPPPARGHARTGRWLRGLAGLAAVAAASECASATGLIPRAFLPPVSAVVVRAATLVGDGQFRVDIAETLRAWGIGLAVAVAAGVPLGVLLGSVPVVNTAVRAVVEFLRPIPSVALIPLVSLILGVGLATESTLVAYAAIWPVLYNTVYGLADVEPVAIQTMRVFGFGRLDVLRRVCLPAAAPFIATGIRLAAGVALILAVGTEILAGFGDGLGVFIAQAQMFPDGTTDVLAGTLWAGLFGLVINAVLVLGERRLFRWHVTQSGSGTVTMMVTTPDRPRWHSAAAAAVLRPAARPVRSGAGALLAVLHRWLILAVLVLGWEAATRSARSVFFPPPSAIAARMYHLWFSGPVSHAFFTSAAIGNILPSLARMAVGLVAATVVGVSLGLALGRSERVFEYLDPLLQFLRVIPPPTLVPVFIVLLHLGTPMQLTSIAFSAVWPILLNTADGARSIDLVQLATARVFRLPATTRLWKIIVPATMPKVFAGLRLSLSLCLILMVFSELLPGTANGIGFELTDAQSRSDLRTVWAAIVLLGILGYLLNALLLSAERRVLAWHRAARADGPDR